ncbi:hypothetical protein GJA_2526 [Janthinobacterium agaricidamnosum NBRC 102515 = DSM 9628]|uniref:Uncharacterized protein n=2 Tax=Janthinobacterium agaricidamnosum TaxID=55508 RepID=W0V7B2_9BURK|nr:hypothetical protein GJA_2526 [Janthinobacterium agaricidamnosum NBRC 102515 = DSM 9628]
MLDSANTPLWQWHNDGTLDLYALAGLLSFSSLDVFRPRAWVRSVGADGKDTVWPVTRSVINEYLADQDRTRVRRLRVYAMRRTVVSEQIDIATRKHKKLGIHLNWDQGTAITDTEFLTLEIKEKSEYAFSIADQHQGLFVIRRGLRTGEGSGEECTALALALFQITEGNHGNTEGRDLFSPCANFGRTDSCCATLSVMPGENGTGSSVVYRETWPSLVFRYVLAHELGHYFGLCHYGHDGLQNIMYTAAKDEHLSMLDIGLLNVYMQGEPEFTQDDGRNCWRFIVNQLQCCLELD